MSVTTGVGRGNAPGSREHLLRGIEDVKKYRQMRLERVAEFTKRVEEEVQTELESLPEDMQDSPLVVKTVRNKVRAELLLDRFYENAAGGQAVNLRSIEAAIRLFNVCRKANGDLLAHWPNKRVNTENKRNDAFCAEVGV